MTAILTIFAAATVAAIAHLVYGAVLAGRNYDLSEQAWTNAAERLIPRQPPVRRALPRAKAQLQRA